MRLAFCAIFKLRTERRMKSIITYTNPVVKGHDSGRLYVYYTNIISKEKFRLYSGKQFGMGGTRGLTKVELDVYFRSLCATVTIKLSEGWQPEMKTQSVRPQSSRTLKLKECAELLINHIDGSAYSRKHKINLKLYLKQLVEQFGLYNVSDINGKDMLSYLTKRYPNNNTTYNTAKRYYKCIFNIMTELGYTSSNPVSGIKNKRAVASINRAFEPDELTALLAYLKEHDRVLYRVSILMYTTFLRPHKEIRLLRARYFDLKSGLLILPSRYTKNGKQVTIPLQTLVKDELSFIADMQPDDFVFGVVNPDYFSTRWGKKIRGVYPLKENQTLYSIRHTAAVDMYKRTKDVALIQNLMRHSSMEVTLGYLRSLNCNLNVVSAELYPNLILVE